MPSAQVACPVALIDAITTSPAIKKRTRAAVCRALDFAWEEDRPSPALKDCVRACVDMGADLEPVAASWGFVRAHDDFGDHGPYHDVRRTYNGEDQRRGVVEGHETLLCLTAFSLFTGIDVPFRFDFRATARRSDRS